MKTICAASIPVLLAAASAPASAQIQTAWIPCVADAAIYSESGSVANGAGEYLFVGMNSLADVRRSLVRFDVASVLPPGSIVVSAQFACDKTQPSSTAEVLTARRVLSSWSEGPSNPAGAEGQGTAASGADVTWTWRDFAAGTAWTSAGGDVAPNASFSGPLGTLGGAYSMTTGVGLDDVRSWLADPAHNHGWMLSLNEVVAGSAERLYSRSSPDSTRWPRLLVLFFGPGAQPQVNCLAHPNSTGTDAQIASSGPTSVAANAFGLSTIGLPPGSSGMYFFGPRVVAPAMFGDSYLCVATPHHRLGIQTANASGAVSRALDFTTFPGTLLASGTSAAFQYWYRDPAAAGTGFSTSNALIVPFFP